MASASPHGSRDFTKGVLAHLILVPAWTVPPPLLLGSVITCGAYHGKLCTFACLCMGAGFVMSTNMMQRLPLSLGLFAFAATAPKNRAVAIAAAGVASFLAWWCKGGRADFKKWPEITEFICKWSSHYYAKAELRGEMNSIKKGKTVFAFHPHGCLSTGWSINACFNKEFAKNAGKVWFLCDYNLRYKNPFFRWLCDATKSEDMEIDAADKKTILRLMEGGDSWAIIPGGFQDAVAHAYGKDCTYLKKRKGFIKYCLQYGYRVHPVYTFGECETFYALTWFRRLRMKISEQNIPMILFFGWPLLPVLPLPQSKILTYVGPALELPQIRDPTKEDIDNWHAKYVDSLKKLFDSKKAEAGFPHASLEII